MISGEEMNRHHGCAKFTLRLADLFVKSCEFGASAALQILGGSLRVGRSQ